MNGRKAKMFRALAGVSKSDKNTYKGIGNTVRTKEVLHPTKLNSNGKPKVIGKYKTATYALNNCARVLNKLLKKQYKAALRSDSKNMLAAAR